MAKLLIHLWWGWGGGEVWFGSLVGGVYTGKRKLTINILRNFQIPSLAIPENIKLIRTRVEPNLHTESLK